MSLFKKIIDFINDDEINSNSGSHQSYRPTPPPMPKMGHLAPPPPPPVPTNNEVLSVRIAVNGQSYGPYERATLLEMIDNGSLTRETLVFMKGMSEWKPASQVAKVNELFGNTDGVPEIPPIPWTDADETSKAGSASSGVKEENVLSPRLNRLITAAIADGVITDLERQVLLRNAQEEGVAMDEFVMILEARLYEQQQLLLNRQKEMEHKQNMEKAAAKAAAAAAAPKNGKMPLTKCPQCGAPIKALATSCPDCGYEYATSNNETMTSSASERLAKQLNDLERPESKGILNAYSQLIAESMSGRTIFSKKAAIIRNFPIPNTKNDIFDLFNYCITNSKGNVFNEGYEITKAYKNKSKEILTKARVVLADDEKLLKQMYELAKQYKLKI